MRTKNMVFVVGVMRGLAELGDRRAPRDFAFRAGHGRASTGVHNEPRKARFQERLAPRNSATWLYKMRTFWPRE